MGSALPTFHDFQLSTGPSIMTGPDKLVNEAQKHSYLLRKALKGKDMDVVVQGGSSIKDQLMFDESNTFKFVHPMETNAWSMPQVLTEWEIPWRFGLDHMAWTAQEVEFNVQAGMTRSARHHQYKRLKRQKEQRMWTSMLNGMEAALAAVPDVAGMESAQGKLPYSIPAFINEQADGLFFKTATVTGKTAWATKQGIDPTQEARWKPQTETYSTGSITAGSKNIIAAFDVMFHKTRFKAPGTREEYFENDTYNRQCISASRAGVTLYTRLMRDSQDTYVSASRQDPAFVNPTYAGIDVYYWSELDNAALYQAQTASNPLVSEIPSAGVTAAIASGPRYYWKNFNYINMVFHATRYMYLHGIKEHPNQHNTFVRPVDCWYNLVAQSLQRQGIVFPSVDVYDENLAAVA